MLSFQCYYLQLTDKLTKAEAEIQASKMSRDDLLAQTESQIAARGAGRN